MQSDRGHRDADGSKTIQRFDHRIGPTQFDVILISELLWDNPGGKTNSYLISRYAGLGSSGRVGGQI